jgi:hypothetical protein
MKRGKERCGMRQRGSIFPPPAYHHAVLLLSQAYRSNGFPDAFFFPYVQWFLPLSRLPVRKSGRLTKRHPVYYIQPTRTLWGTVTQAPPDPPARPILWFIRPTANETVYTHSVQPSHFIGFKSRRLQFRFLPPLGQRHLTRP